jgi:hypothetical protein
VPILTNRAVADLRKLEDYCLNPSHFLGRHKARVFQDALGIGREDAAWLRDALIAAVSNTDATEQANDRFGKRWRLDIPLERQGRSAMVRSIWMMHAGESDLRLVTCWVL